MFSQRHLRLCAGAFLMLGAFLGLAARQARADLNHARIIRLSQVQGDVRFTRDAHGDPLTESKNLWEAAVLNLPIREGYVLATDRGRAAVEFENGAMAFLDENTVVEFYDLSIDNGARTTRLILRQGTASFYVASGHGDYFSVTGGDFTAEATGRATFRLDNYDDGSNVNVLAGHVSAVRKEHSTAVGKGESFSITAGNGHVNIGSLPRSDDFDRWVSSRIASSVAATSAGLQYANSSDYTSGFGDLYTYGSWYPVSSYGFGWQPFGVGLGWSPFDAGGWFMDSAFGWGFIGYQPWGWLPYHFGGWLFEPGLGWVWVPGNFGYAGYSTWRPATVSWVHSKTGATGIVPAHPLDIPGKTSANLAHGVFPVTNGGVISSAAAEGSAEWKVAKAPLRGALSNLLSASARPKVLSRSMLSGGTDSRVVRFGDGAEMIYDAREHRFTNTSGAGGVTSQAALRTAETSKTPANAAASTPRSAVPPVADMSAARRNEGVAPRRSMTPAPSPVERSAGNGTWSSENSSGAAGRVPASGPSSATPRSSSGTSGGRPH
jgi:hypothetical protein